MISAIYRTSGIIEYGIVDKVKKIAIIPDNYCIWIYKIKGNKKKENWTLGKIISCLPNVTYLELLDGAGYKQQLEQFKEYGEN